MGPITAVAAFVYVPIDQAELVLEGQVTRPDNQAGDPVVAFRTALDVGNAIGE